jgi:hypothetical protein
MFRSATLVPTENIVLYFQHTTGFPRYCWFPANSDSSMAYVPDVAGHKIVNSLLVTVIRY